MVLFQKLPTALNHQKYGRNKKEKLQSFSGSARRGFWVDHEVEVIGRSNAMENGVAAA